jgi:hypothetical protein
MGRNLPYQPTHHQELLRHLTPAWEAAFGTQPYFDPTRRNMKTNLGSPDPPCNKSTQINWF